MRGILCSLSMLLTSIAFAQTGDFGNWLDDTEAYRTEARQADYPLALSKATFRHVKRCKDILDGGGAMSDFYCRAAKRIVRLYIAERQAGTIRRRDIPPQYRERWDRLETFLQNQRTRLGE